LSSLGKPLISTDFFSQVLKFDAEAFVVISTVTFPTIAFPTAILSTIVIPTIVMPTIVFPSSVTSTSSFTKETETTATMEQAAKQTWDIITPVEAFETVKTTNKAIFDEYIAKGFCGMSEALRTKVFPNHNCPQPMDKFGEVFEGVWLYVEASSIIIASTLAVTLTVAAVIIGFAHLFGAFNDDFDYSSNRKRVKEVKVADAERGMGFCKAVNTTRPEDEKVPFNYDAVTPMAAAAICGDLDEESEDEDDDASGGAATQEVKSCQETWEQWRIGHPAFDV